MAAIRSRGEGKMKERRKGEKQRQPAKQRTIKVRIISAQDLEDVRLIGKMRCYAVVYIDPEHKAYTRIAEHGGLNPFWNQLLVLQADEELFRRTWLLLTWIFTPAVISGATNWWVLLGFFFLRSLKEGMPPISTITPLIVCPFSSEDPRVVLRAFSIFGFPPPVSFSCVGVLCLSV